MIEILSLNVKISRKIKGFRIEKKFIKQINLLSQNPRHPSLNLELLEPKDHGIYSFRIDIKYRGLFIFRNDKKAIEMIAVTKHYR